MILEVTLLSHTLFWVTFCSCTHTCYLSQPSQPLFVQNFKLERGKFALHTASNFKHTVLLRDIFYRVLTVKFWGLKLRVCEKKDI